MDFISILLVFSILENAGQFASASGCSLLPKGSPKCFPDAVDYEADNKELREIKYRLSKKDMFGYNINVGPEVAQNFPKIKLVRVGKAWVDTVGSKKDTVMCAKSKSKDDYLLEYAPYLYDYSGYSKDDNGDFKDSDSTKPGGDDDDKVGVVGETEVTKLFQITKKEVWNCKNNKVNFKRVVTEMVGLVPLGIIYFFDGIEVATTPLPWEYVPDLNNTLVREVKYIDSKDNNRVVRYDGHLEFKRDIYDSGFFKPVRYDDFAKVYISAGENRMKTYIELRSQFGKHYEDIHRPYGYIGRKTSKATCYNLDEDRRLFHIKYLPHWAERSLYEVEGYRLEALDSNNFEARFIVTKHEIWSCQIQNPVPEDGDGKFERHVLEYIGVNSVQTLDYYSGNEVWQYDIHPTKEVMSITDDLNIRFSEQSIGIRSELFFEGESDQRKFYVGELENKIIEQNKEPKKELSFWRRLYNNLFSKEDDLPEGQYKTKIPT